MAISYNKLWKLLVDKKMSKADLRKAAGIAPNTMTRLRRDEEVTLSVLNRIYLLPRNRLHDGLCGLVQSVQCRIDQRP